MTKAQVLTVLRSNENAAIYVDRGEVYLDDGDAVRMISPRMLCALYRDGRGEIAPDPQNASIWLAI